MADLQFKNNNPGAVRHGNFINYYKFNSAEERLKLLQFENLFDNNKPIIALDIGCNTGELTFQIYEQIKELNEVHILGIDIDPTLILRANEKNTYENITFESLNFMNEEHRKTVVNSFLNELNVPKFSVVFCFAVTMWIHLNEGDRGLVQFLNEICDVSDMIIIEPQPWKCYKSAVSRMKKAKYEFPLLKQLNIKDDVEDKIDSIILASNKLQKVYETKRTKWGRKISVYKQSSNVNR